MQLRVLVVVGYQTPLDISATLADAVYEIAERTGVNVTVTSEHRSDAAGRRQLAGQHLIHVIGTPTPTMLELARDGLPLVVTPVRRPRRTRPMLARRPPGDLRWLVHGRSNAAALVNEGVAPSSHVLPLPVLPHLGVHAAEWAQLRARSRAELGVSPGQHVVIGYGPSSERLCRALGTVARSPRHDIVPVWIVPGSCEPAWYDAAQRGLPREPHVVGEAAGRRLLPAMDLLVAAGSAFTARSPAVDAAAAGIPVLSTPSDVASDFVDLAEGGSLLVGQDAGQIVAAVDDALHETARGRASRLRPPTAQDGDTVIATVERCYARALRRPLSSTTTLLRSVRS